MTFMKVKILLTISSYTYILLRWFKQQNPTLYQKLLLATITLLFLLDYQVKDRVLKLIFVLVLVLFIQQELLPSLLFLQL